MLSYCCFRTFRTYVPLYFNVFQSSAAIFGKKPIYTKNTGHGIGQSCSKKFTVRSFLAFKLLCLNSIAALQRCSWKKCSENTLQIYSRIPMPMCNFNNFNNFSNFNFPVNLLRIFGTTFPKNTSGGLLLLIIRSLLTY